jgi:hypothetical protein
LNRYLGGTVPTTVYNIEEIELSDGSSLIIRPLTIKYLKKFLAVIKKADSPEISSEEEIMEIFAEAAMVCLQQLKPELSEDLDKFEEIIEVPTMMKILELAGGLKLNDPNLGVAGLDGMI